MYTIECCMLFSVIGRHGRPEVGEFYRQSGQRFQCCYDERSSQSFERNFFFCSQFYESVVCFGMTRICVHMCI